jgi:hypothetical protein
MTTILFSWDDPGKQYTNTAINIFWTTNLTTPTNQWPKLVTVYTPTNVGPGRLGFYTNLTPNNYFFTAAWTNVFWHTQDFFSPGVATPLNPTNPVSNLGLSSQ